MTDLKNPPYYMNIFFRREYGKYTGGYGIVEAGKSMVYPIIDFETCEKLYSGYQGIFKTPTETMYVPVYSDIRFVRYSRFSDMVHAHEELNNQVIQQAIQWRFNELGIKMLTKEEEKNVKQVVEYDPSAGENISKIRDNIEKYFENLPRMSDDYIYDEDIDLLSRSNENAD